ncbi:MAG: CoA-binding protein [Peptococcaceae bacterium]
MDSFFQKYQSFAVLGLSRNPRSFSRGAYHFLKEQGYRLYPVTPHADSIDDIKCAKSLAEIPDVEGAIFFTNPEVSKELLSQCREKGIKNLWFQTGSLAKDELAKVKDSGFNATNSCVYLHHPASGFPHNVHKFVVNFWGKD